MTTQISYCFYKSHHLGQRPPNIASPLNPPGSLLPFLFISNISAKNLIYTLENLPLFLYHLMDRQKRCLQAGTTSYHLQPTKGYYGSAGA